MIDPMPDQSDCTREDEEAVQTVETEIKPDVSPDIEPSVSPSVPIPVKDYDRLYSCAEVLLDRFPIAPLQFLLDKLEFYRSPDTTDSEFQSIQDILRGMDAGHRGFCSRYLTMLLEDAGPSADCFVPAVQRMAAEWRVRRCRPDQYPVDPVNPVDPVEPVASTSRVEPVVSPDTTVDEPNDEPDNEETVPKNTAKYSNISE